MTWTKLDDNFHSHPKSRQAWTQSRASIGLHALALSYAGDYETDGDIPCWFVESILPDPGERQGALDALTSSGLWDATEDGFRIHDFLDFNPSRATLEARREEDKRRKAAAANGKR